MRRYLLVILSVFCGMLLLASCQYKTTESDGDDDSAYTSKDGDEELDVEEELEFEMELEQEAETNWWCAHYDELKTTVRVHGNVIFPEHDGETIHVVIMQSSFWNCPEHHEVIRWSSWIEAGRIDIAAPGYYEIEAEIQSDHPNASDGYDIMFVPVAYTGRNVFDCISASQNKVFFESAPEGPVDLSMIKVRERQECFGMDNAR